MAKDLGTIWDLEPHTAAKHAILRRYLQAWIPILSSAHEHVIYIDGFAGPGVYRGGADGSPVIALKSALAHSSRVRGEMEFLFVELDTQRKESLERCIAAMALPANFRVRVRLDRCDEVVSKLLDDLDASGESLSPTFAFLDPFGFSHTPLALVKRLMSHKRCEVLITFMYEEINRFLTQGQIPQHFDALFGCPQWRSAQLLADSGHRRAFLRDLYRSQLERDAAITYVRSFEMFNRHNQTDYFLFFGTKSIDGLRKMKEAMWKVDDSGTFSFSDATDPNQSTLFDGGPDVGDLQRRILAEFRGRRATVEDIEQFVVVQTPYRETHFKRQVLVPMEKASPPELEVLSAPPGRKKGAFPAGTVLRFL